MYILLERYAQKVEAILINNKTLKSYYKKIKSSEKRFINKNRPSISILNYLQRIIYYTDLEESTIILSLIYIIKLSNENKIFINEYNIHRIILASLLASHKYNEDKIHYNKYLAKVGGINEKELITIQDCFIDLLEFKFFIDEKYYNEFSKELLNNTSEN